MVESWSEVSQAKDENRYELVLSGADVSKRIVETGLDISIFDLNNLNFLEISKTTLNELPDLIGNLVNLSQLVLHSNQLKSLPRNIEKLSKLKNLDVSRNQITELPDELCSLIHIQYLNASCNQLSELPKEFNRLSKLIVLDVSQNDLKIFPIDSAAEFNYLTEIKAKGNKIDVIPSSVNNLSNLRVLDLEENSLLIVPGELAECGKLKDLNLKGNGLKDKRLKKMLEQCHPKQVLEYIRSHCPKQSANESTKKEKTKAKKGGKGKKKDDADVEQLQDLLNVLHLTDLTPFVTVTDSVKEVRPHILCCIIRNVDMAVDNKLKKFIALQTKLHDNDCDKRNAATIATHDLAKIAGNLIYDACPPQEIKLFPLQSQKEVSAEEFYNQLRKDAEALRKEKKRNTYSGIHKYLYLLDGKPLYPCLKTENLDKVISFPPITNSDISKISSTTTDVFVEVTSSSSLAICKKVLDSLLLSSLVLGLGSSQTTNSDSSEKQNEETENATTPPNQLTVEQVKIVDKIGQLRAVYPSRTDLQVDSIRVVRNFE